MADDFSTMADCEPSPSLRNRIADDLNIKGQVSFPQRIDMRAIIPVYNFQASEPFRVKINRAYQNVGGLASYTATLIDLFPETPIPDYGVLTEWSMHIGMNAADRAAIAGDRINFVVWPLSRSAVSYAAGGGIIEVFAAAGYALSTHINGTFRVNEVAYIENVLCPGIYIDGFRNYKMARDEGLRIIITRQSAGNFPASTEITWWARTLIYGKND